MDPRLLERDEFELEMNIREIDKNDQHAMTILCEYLDEELVGTRGVPTKLHSSYRTATSEVSNVGWKLASIRFTTGDLQELAKCRSRLLHLFGRILRVEREAGGNAHIARLKGELEVSMDTCTKIMETQLNVNTPDPEKETIDEKSRGQAQALLSIISTIVEQNDNPGVPSSKDPMATALTADEEVPSNFSLNLDQPGATSLNFFDPNQSKEVEATSVSDQSTSNVPIQPPQGNLLQALKAIGSRLNIPLTTNSASTSTLSHKASLSQVVQSAQVPDPIASAQIPSCSNTAAPPPLPSNQINQCLEMLTRLLSRGAVPPPLNHPPVNTIPQYNQYAHPPPHSAYVPPAQADHAMYPQERPHQIYLPAGNSNYDAAISKWQLKYGAGPRDITVGEFVSRLEMLASLAHVPQSALTLALQQILTGTALSWFYMYIQNHPNPTWALTRRELIRAFQSNVSDTAIRRLIMDRLQRPGETFTEYQIAIQGLEARLSARMTPVELLDSLRSNLLPHIQEKLLFVPINSIYQLQTCVHEVEDLVHRNLEVQHLRRSIPRVNEISYYPPVANELEVSPGYYHNLNVPPPPMGLVGAGSTPFAGQMPVVNPVYSQSGNNYEVGAIVDRNEYIRCWNCDELGHTYLDCAAPRTIFCYGCGEKNVVRPQCPKCAVRNFSGNGQRSIRPAGNPQSQMRAGGQMLQRYHPLQRPQ